METINKNLRFLREKANITQKELANRLKVKPPVIGSYEEGRSIPPVLMSIKIAQLFDVTLDRLLLMDLKALGEGLEKNKIIRGREVLTITVDSAGDENVELVTHKASAGYINGYYDPEYIKELPKISIPFLSKSNTYRAFEITGQSMLPVKSGDIIIGKYLDNLEKIKNGKTYIIVSKTNGIVYKRILESLSDNLLLISDNSTYDPFTIALSDVLEVWAFVIRLTQEEEQPELPLMYIEKIMKIKQDTDGTAF
jgi:transcriptional regulator with XRE-family HTH domain